MADAAAADRKAAALQRYHENPALRAARAGEVAALDRFMATLSEEQRELYSEVESAVANVLPVRNSAMARRSRALRPFAIVTIPPVSIAESTRSGSMARN